MCHGDSLMVSLATCLGSTLIGSLMISKSARKVDFDVGVWPGKPVLQDSQWVCSSVIFCIDFSTGLEKTASDDCRGDEWCNGYHVCFPSLPPMLLCGFESRLGLESLGCSTWHFLKLVVRGFLRVLRFPPLYHRLMVQPIK